MNERLSVNVEVERGSTLTLTRDLPDWTRHPSLIQTVKFERDWRNESSMVRIRDLRERLEGLSKGQNWLDVTEKSLKAGSC